MKTTHKIFFLLALIILSCASAQTEKQISKFQNNLGKDNYVTLKFLTAEFEKNFLKKNYPTLSIEKSYERFLIDVKNGEVNFKNKISTKNRDIFNESNLKLEIYEFPDSVWIGKNGIESRYIFKDKDGEIDRNDDGTINYGYSLKSADLNKNQDSIVQKEYMTPRLRYSGKYLKAIRAIKKDGEFYEAFYNVKDKAGSVKSEIMAEIILKSNPDFSNPITKGLIVMEFGY